MARGIQTHMALTFTKHDHPIHSSYLFRKRSISHSHITRADSSKSIGPGIKPARYMHTYGIYVCILLVVVSRLK